MARRNPCNPYIGVSWHSRDKRWRAKIKHEGKHFHLGDYRDAKTAARVFDYVARVLRGPGATVNFDGKLPKIVSWARVATRLLRQGLDIRRNARRLPPLRPVDE